MPPLLSFGKPTSAIGLDIGTNSIRATELSINQDPPLLTRLGVIRVSPGLIKEGEITDVKGVSSVLRELWSKSHLSRKNVVLGIANQKVVVRLIDLPWMEESELRGAIRFQAQEYIPMPVEETIIDFEIQKEYEVKKAEERMNKVLLVAAQKEMINNFVKAMAGAGLAPQSIDVKSFALMRSLIPRLPVAPTEKQAKEAMKTVCLLNIGAGITNMIIVEERVPYFVRILIFGGNDFTQALVDGLKVSPDEAEEIKIALSKESSQKSAKGGAKKQEQYKKAQDILKPKISSFVKEVRRSVDYCLDQTGCRTPEKIVLSGRGSQLLNLSSEIEKALGIKVEFGKPLQNVRTGKLRISDEELAEIEPSLAVPIGLALRGVEK